MTGRPSRTATSTRNGTRKCVEKLGWPLAWWMIPGAKPIAAPPSQAATRDRTTYRENT